MRFVILISYVQTTLKIIIEERVKFSCATLNKSLSSHCSTLCPQQLEKKAPEQSREKTEHNFFSSAFPTSVLTGPTLPSGYQAG